MFVRTVNPRNRIVFSAVVLMIGLGVVWYQRSHSALGKAGGSKKPFLSQAPSSEGSKTFAWVPVYPEATVSGIRTKMTRGELSYGFSFQTPDGSGKVLSFYRSRLQAAGFMVDVKSSGDAGVQLHAQESSGKRSLDLTAGGAAEGTEAGVLAVEK
jgi:hypothetical protein